MKKVFKAAVFAMAGLMAFTSCGEKSADTIKIGAIGPYSGAVAVYGTECINGIKLAADEINNAGGINGKKIEIISEDDEGNPEKSVNAYKKIVTKDKAKLIIGSLTSGCTMAITSLAQAQKVLMIAPAATAPAITSAGDYVFRACFIDPFQGTVGAKFALESLGVKKAAILYDIGNDYSSGLTENFVKTFTNGGGTIVAQESYSTGDKDFNAQLTKIKNAKPDFVYLPDYYGTISLIAKQLRAQGITTPIVGADGWDGLTADAGEEVLNGYYSNHYAADSTEGAVKTFVDNFRAKYDGKTPTAFAALGYDAVYMLRDSIIKAGSSDSTKVRDALKALDGNYVTGHLTFDENRNPVKSAVMVKLVKQDGKFTAVYNTTVEP
ncbi:ABC transporter substrate-binding protein [Treponema pectinovorum]|uniref:ABC transporter substrate-binding protein n=1 Tax=Treponema pectinovorum TaxID=164 RepID=UPI0011CB673D|nr:ABC transporter substrate-binding protein [Treponema pectinovorum]